MELTPDLKPEWAEVGNAMLNILRRLQSEARTDGCAILSIKVAVNADGVPLCWTNPSVKKLEPKATCNINELLEALSG